MDERIKCGCGNNGCGAWISAYPDDNTVIVSTYMPFNGSTNIDLNESGVDELIKQLTEAKEVLRVHGLAGRNDIQPSAE